MKKIILTLCITAAAFSQDLPFSKGEINPYSKYFTGTTYLNTFDDAQGGRSANASLVTFEPCSRTHWHTHEKGQLLIILSGEGVVKKRGKRR